MIFEATNKSIEALEVELRRARAEKAAANFDDLYWMASARVEALEWAINCIRLCVSDALIVRHTGTKGVRLC